MKTIKLVVTILLLFVYESALIGGDYYKDLRYEIDYHNLTNTFVKQATYMKQIQCLARNIYYEARGESWEGQMAVAKVTLNRVESELFPNTICGVVEEKYKVKGYTVCQFSWYCEPWNDRKLKLSQNNQSYQVALDAILHKDIPTWMTEDVFWFHTKQVKPRWRKIHERVAIVDNHIFYKKKSTD